LFIDRDAKQNKLKCKYLHIFLLVI
jgi:hypothetical protein